MELRVSLTVNIDMNAQSKRHFFVQKRQELRYKYLLLKKFNH